MSFVIRLYDYLRAHRSLCLTSLLLTTVALALSLSRQEYKEDISDFLPLGSKYGHALQVYQEVSGANRIFAIIESSEIPEVPASPDRLAEAVEAFASIVQERDTTGLAASMVSQIDMEQTEQVAQFIYANMPYFLTDRDYARMDSLLSDDSFIATQLATDKQMLMLPMAGMMAQNVGRDPLNLFTPLLSTLQQRQAAVNYENYDGYIFTPDMGRAIVMMQSPYGGSETSQNARLLRFLDDCATKTMDECPGVDIHFTGGPVIAVGNAQQIKTDSILAVGLAMLLIVGLLFAVFRRVTRLLLILAAIAWGWLFAMGILAVLHDSVSVIVVGISSVIMGIAVNYPLHLLAHLRHTPAVRQALREIVAPLLVGNITTVGAFLALVPLESVALRDLGLFSSLLLVGTIVFVLIFLPHFVGAGPAPARPAGPAPARSEDPVPARQQPAFMHRQPLWLPIAITAVTLVLGYFSLDTTFDSNISNINYMSPQQRQDMEYFATVNSQTSNLNSQTLYVVSSGSTADAALSHASHLCPLLDSLKAQGVVAAISGCQPFLCSQQEQQHRLSLWHDFVSRHREAIAEGVAKAARAEGFADGTFDDFFLLFDTRFEPQPLDYFAPLTTTVFASSLVNTEGTDYKRTGTSVIDVLTLNSRQSISRVTALIDQHTCPAMPQHRCSTTTGSHYAFDIQSMNSSIATRLSDDFNYIGWACSAIVFLFLWFSLGSLELAMLSFLPMAVSWVWILGLMSLLDIHFNVVNIILATFIFGQGDDYTIFMTEGCQYEYAYRRPMLASYKKSIVISALIMFIGIGVLIFARHPALRSLAEVTIVGMSSVVLMAWLLPPLVFRWLVSKDSGYRRRPLSFALLLRRAFDEKPGTPAYFRHLVYDRYRYKGLGITTTVARNLRRFSSSSTTFPAASPAGTIAVVNSGYGELPLLLALQHPEATIFALDADPDKLLVARNSADQIAPNLTFLEKQGPEQMELLTAAHPGLQVIQLPNS
jgi:predicted exporter